MTDMKKEQDIIDSSGNAVCQNSIGIVYSSTLLEEVPRMNNTEYENKKID